ncbi:MAG TPA: MBL fold metallo-hydrolase, partial [Ktedonobacterales bacterium]|nr:MBL fold metallo-hydrolase [Ktedonobacterales bacterium]
ILVDAGFPQRTLANRLRQVGVEPAAISAIFLTHEHYDHACGAVAFARRFGAALIADPRTLAAVFAQAATSAASSFRRAAADVAEDDMPADVASAPGDLKRVERVEMAVGGSWRLKGLEARSFAISHDAVAPCGYLLGTSAWKVCVVIDTGEITPPILEAMREGRLLVIEANHDRARLLSGPYPLHLKRRILGPTGHLSNEQTAQALANTLDDSPRWVWLAHLSRTNNTPDLARTQVCEALRALGLGAVAPQVAPPGPGPAWDSATLFTRQRLS